MTRVIENWKTDERIFNSLNVRDCIGKEEIVYQKFGKRVETLKRDGLGKIKMNEYFWRNKEAILRESFNYNIEDTDRRINHEAKIDELEYNALDKFLMEAEL